MKLDGRPKLAEDRGEVASWLVIAAGLAIAATLASAQLGSVITQLAANLGTDAGAISVAAGPAGSPAGPSGAPADAATPGAQSGADASTTGQQDDPGAAGNPTGQQDDPGAAGNPGDTATAAAQDSPGEVLAPTDTQLADIDRLAREIANAPDGPTASTLQAELREQLAPLFSNDADLDAALGLIEDGASAELAYAQVTGDWTGIPGGDPANYNDAQRALVLAVLGIDAPANGEGIPELFQAIPAWAVADLFDSGRTRVNRPGDLSPSGTTSLSNPQIGVGFTQTQTATITVETRTSQSGVEISAGAAVQAAGSAINLLNTLNKLPPSVVTAIGNSPLLSGALKAVSFNLTAQQYEGTQVQYEATLTVAQAQALDAGFTDDLPNLYDPSSFQDGNSILIRGGDISGTEFEIGYRGAHFGSEQTEFEGLGWGVTNEGDGIFAIYEGPISEVERQLAVGAGPFSLVASTSVTGSELDVAFVDINTPEGAAAYDAFVAGQGIPSSDGTGVVTATTESVTVGNELGFRVSLGPLSETASLINESADRTVTTLSDGTATSTATFSNSETQIQVVAPVNADGSSDNDNAVFTIVYADLEPGTANELATAFNGTHPAPGTNQHAQVQLTSQQLLGLRDFAASQQTGQSAFSESLAAAQTAADVMVILVNNANLRGSEGAELIANMASTARNEDGERFLGALEGDVAFRDASS